MTNGGGDVTVQSSGLSINLVTKSGSNVFKGSARRHLLERQDAGQQRLGGAVQRRARTGSCRATRSSGSPTTRSNTAARSSRTSCGSGARPTTRTSTPASSTSSTPAAGQLCQALIAAQRTGSAALRALVTYDKLEDVQKCLSNDKTVIKNLQWKFNYQANSANKFQYLFQSDNKYRNARGASPTTLKEATTQQTSDKPWGLPLPTHSITHTLIASRPAGVQQPVHLRARRVLPGLPGRAAAGRLRAEPLRRASDTLLHRAATPSCLWNIQSLSNNTTSISSRSLTVDLPDDAAFVGSQDGRHLLPDEQAGRRPHPEVRPRLAPEPDPDVLALQRRRARRRAVRRQQRGELRHRRLRRRSARRPASCRARRSCTAISCTNNDWWTYNGYIQDSFSRGRWRLNGGLRYDWQQSKYLGGCVPANILVPDLLPAQCEEATQTDVDERQEDPAVQQLVAARLGHLRPVRQRQDADPRQRVVLLQHEDHAGQRARAVSVTLTR